MKTDRTAMADKQETFELLEIVKAQFRVKVRAALVEAMEPALERAVDELTESVQLTVDRRLDPTRMADKIIVEVLRR